ncbi:MAG: hypothetical protein AAGM22_17280 [Acidobacteriota bacterium]
MPQETPLLPRLDPGQESPEAVRALVDRELVQSEAFLLIQEVYRGRVARRTGVSYLQHIEDGVYVLVRLFGWRPRVVDAYCVHPIFQSDKHLARALAGELAIDVLSTDVVALAMEYRRVANAYISTMKPRRGAAIKLSPLAEVNAMLAADKVQNKKDFMAHLYFGADGGPKPSSLRYLEYFDSWLERLGLSAASYDRLVNELAAVGPRNVAAAKT